MYRASLTPVSILLLALPAGAAAVPPDPPVTVRRAEVPAGKPSASGLAAREQRILRTLSHLSTEQLRELMEAYARLGNRRMADPVIRELLRREPGNQRAMVLQRSLANAAQLPDDPEGIEAARLIRQGRHAEAAALLLKLKAQRYKDRPFRYQQDLAYALYESGRLSDSQSAFRDLVSDRSQDSTARVDAQNTMRLMMIDEMMRRGESALSGRSAEKAMALADDLLRREPNNADAISLKAAAMSLAGRPREAVDWLVQLKAQTKGLFPHQRSLADALYEARMFDDARAAYLVVLADRRYSPEDRVESQRRLADLERDRRIIAGEHALRKRDFATAEQLLAELTAQYPRHPDVITFRAAILTQQKRYADARDLLTRVRSAQPGTTFFEARPDLAVAEANTGLWGPAIADFRVVENEARFDNQTRYEAARLGRELQARVRPTITTGATFSDEAEGKLWSGELELSTGVFGEGKNIIYLRSIWDDIRLKEDRMLSRKEAERYQAEVAWRRIIGQGYFGELAVGGNDAGRVVFGGSIGRYEMPGTGWELRFRANERATDSLSLMTLDGTQHSLAFNIHRKLNDRWFLDATAAWRRVEVDGHALGQGIDFDMNLGYTLIEEALRRPEVALNFFSEMQWFDRRSLDDGFARRALRGRKEFGPDDLGAALIDERINRHGLLLTVSKQFNHRWSGYVYGGVAYEFEVGELEGRAGAGIEAFLSRNATFTLGVDYSTSGNAGNRGDDVITATAGLRMSF